MRWGWREHPCNTALVNHPLLSYQVLESLVELSIPQEGIVFEGLVLRLSDDR